MASDTAQRIRDALDAAGVPDGETAVALGLSPQAWDDFVDGREPLSAEALTRALSLCDIPLERLFSPFDSVSARYRRDGAVEAENDAGQEGPPVSDLVEDLARDVKLLTDTRSLPADRNPVPPVFSPHVDEAERLALWARKQLGSGHAPITDAQGDAARLGLLLFVVPQPPTPVEGAYLRLAENPWGVAWLPAGSPADTARRRFTSAHELGHHLWGDDYRAETHETEGESLANAFAINFLLPRAGAEQLFASHAGDPRAAALETATRYGLSWSAACWQLRNLGIFTEQERARLAARTPTGEEFSSQGLLAPGMPDRSVPVVFIDAVLRAYTRRKLSAAKARSMLRDPLVTLPDLDSMPDAARDALLRPAWLVAL